MTQLMHIYYSQPIGYKVCYKQLDLNLFLPDSTQGGIIVEIKYIMHFILHHLDRRTWKTFQKEITANRIKRHKDQHDHQNHTLVKLYLFIHGSY